MKSKPIVVLFGVLALAAIVAITPSAFAASTEVDMASGAGSSANADCVAAKNCFAPNPVTVAPGDTITWKNTDKVGHTVTSGQPSDNETGTVFDSNGLIKPGATFQFTFQNEGTFNYFCQVHPWMTGQVVVSASASSTPSGTGGNATVPEFGSIAPIVLAIAVISIVAFTAKNRVPKL